MNPTFAADPAGRPVLDLRAVARPPDLSDAPTPSPEARAVAIRTWKGRMVNEHASAQVWASLLPQAMRAAVPPALLVGLPAAASDELRHAEQCAGVVLALGGDARAPLPTLMPLPQHDDVGPLEGFLRNILSVGCLSETVAVALIRAEHAELAPGPLRELLGAILADEIQHARLGWTALGLIAPKLDAAAKARTQAYLAVALAHQIEHELPLLPVVSLPDDPALPQLGVCAGADARRLFFDCVEGAILPPLAGLGFDAAGAWAEARRRAAPLAAR
jgi:hypothetical protein